VPRVGVPVATSVWVPVGTTLGVRLAITVGVVVPTVGDTVAVTLEVAVAVTVTVVVAVAVGVGTPTNKLVLEQSLTELPIASCPAVHALLSNWPGAAIVADNESWVVAPGASPLSRVQTTYPVSWSTDPLLVALTKSTPPGNADPTRTSVRATLPGFFTVYVKLTGSPTDDVLGLTELAIDSSGCAHGLPSSVVC
jgi:hypothetical protein